jgi:hypothetical protein
VSEELQTDKYKPELEASSFLTRDYIPKILLWNCMLLPAGMCYLFSIYLMYGQGFSSLGLSSITHCINVLVFFRIEKYKYSVI